MKPGKVILSRAGQESVDLAVLVSPGSARAGLRGIHGNAVKLAVHSPPERGRANSEAESIVAEWLGVSASNVDVVSGPTSRNKVMRITGIGMETVREKLAGLSKA